MLAFLLFAAGCGAGAWLLRGGAPAAACAAPRRRRPRRARPEQRELSWEDVRRWT